MTEKKEALLFFLLCNVSYSYSLRFSWLLYELDVVVASGMCDFFPMLIIVRYKAQQHRRQQRP
jgi:hypothetical protein